MDKYIRFDIDSKKTVVCLFIKATVLIPQVTILTSCKTLEFLERSPFLKAEKHPDFQVTFCHCFVSTNVDFAYPESEQKSIFCKYPNIFIQFLV